MSRAAKGEAVAVDLAKLENMIRRAVREELVQVLSTPVRSLLEGQQGEGYDDAAEDELLLAEALAVLQEYRDKPDAWMSWEDFEAELDSAEAAGELSD